MKALRRLLTILLLTAGGAGAQTNPSNHVINSAGDHRASATLGISVTDNIGEPFTETLDAVSRMMISQGFLQPDIVSGLTIMKNDPTCITREDGYINVAYSTLNPGHQEQYLWSANVTCPPGGCGNRASNLGPGTYSVMVISTYPTGNQQFRSDTLVAGNIVISQNTSPCLIEVFTGVTPNGDGVNDTWHIENISEFPDNKVTLYNRWGAQMFETRGYDNANNFWPRPEMLNTLVSSTYFYIIELGDGSKPLKGWVELLKN